MIYVRTTIYLGVQSYCELAAERSVADSSPSSPKSGAAQSEAWVRLGLTYLKHSNILLSKILSFNI